MKFFTTIGFVTLMLISEAATAGSTTTDTESTEATAEDVSTPNEESSGAVEEASAEEAAPETEIAPSETADDEVVSEEDGQPESTTAEKTPEVRWYVLIGGVSQGPFTEAEIETRVKKGTIKGYTAVSTDGSDNWKLASEVFPKLFAAAPAVGDDSPDFSDGESSSDRFVYKKYVFSPRARSALKKTGFSLVVSGLVTGLAAVACVARGDAPAGTEWAYSDVQCAAYLGGLGGGLIVLSAPFFGIAKLKKRSSTISFILDREHGGITFTKTF